MTRRSLTLLCTAGIGAAGLVAGPGQATMALAAAPGHDRLVSAVPKAETPNVQDGSVDTIYDAGSKMIAGGTFARIRSVGATKDDARVNIFAFDKGTGVVDPAFNPLVVTADGTAGGEVTAIVGGPTADTVFVAGRFANIAGANPKRKNLALLNVADGSVVSTFKAPAFNGAVTDIVLVGDRLIVGGNFTAAGDSPRNGLASLNAATGALDEYLTVGLTENHSWTPGSTNAQAAVGVENLAVSPDGSRLVVIGNFKQADGVLHDQIVKIDLGGTAATIANWNTERFRASCAPASFDSYVRDVAFSPDGEYFVVVSTGGYVKDTACDAAARFEAGATGAGQQPTWIAYTGGDTILSVAISEQAVYIGGHMRWMNNPNGNNVALPGAVTRPSLAALDPVTGLPLSWNPGRHPRGYGVNELHLTPDGLWIGHDQEWIGNQEFKHDRIAFFPLAGGAKVRTAASHELPGRVYSFGANPPAAALLRVNAGGDMIVANDGGPNWQADSAATPSRYHNGGPRARSQTSWVPTIKGIPATTPREIFNSELLATDVAPRIYWNLPVTRGTKVLVRLYFASRCGCAPGVRKINIDIDGVRRATNFDPVAAASGDNIGIMKSYTVTSDGTLDIDLLNALGRPLVNAVEVLRNPAPALVGHENKTYVRSFDGTKPGTRTEITNGGGFAYSGARGGFMVGDTAYVLHGSTMYVRSVAGTTLGTSSELNPYVNAKWDAVLTQSKPVGQTYAGARPEWYYEIPGVTGIFYANGRVYYTIAGHTALYSRTFSPDSGVVGTVRTTVTSPNSMADSGGLFVSGDKLYMVARSTGNLVRMNWTNNAPAGTPVTISGPSIDRADWRAKVTFVGP